MTNRRAIAPLMVAAAIAVMALGASTGAQLTLALMTGSAGVSGNTFTTGTWAGVTTWYLHNAPTPPVGSTLAQFNLGLDATTPSAATLFNYDTNCDGRVGRTIARGGGLVTEAGTCYYATWRSAVLPAARILTGTAALTVWARKTATGGNNPTLRAYLRVFDPATSTYVELGSAGVVVTSAPTAWASYGLSWSLTGISVPVGRQIEVKIVATGTNRDPEIAYDTRTYPASLQLP